MTFFDFAEIFTSRSWIVKEKILRIGCVIAFTRKCYYLYKWIFWSDFFWKAWLQREFVIQDFNLPRREKYPEKVIWMTFQTNVKLYLFWKEFSVKKKDFWWALCVDKKELMSQLISSYIFCMVLAKLIELRTHLLIFDYS